LLISHGNPSTNYGRYETNPEKSVNALAADLMAGHIPIVAEMHYACKEGVLTNEVLKTAYILVSKDWHSHPMSLSETIF
jgi:hypothetical protein